MNNHLQSIYKENKIGPRIEPCGTPQNKTDYSNYNDSTLPLNQLCQIIESLFVQKHRFI